MKRSTKRAFRERAIRWRITSESEVDWKIAPSPTSCSRRVRKLVRLPLWASATPPASRSANIGWTLRMKRAAGGGVAGVADGEAAGQALGQVDAAEGVADLAHVPLGVEALAVEGRRCRRLPGRGAAGRAGPAR